MSAIGVADAVPKVTGRAAKPLFLLRVGDTEGWAAEFERTLESGAPETFSATPGAASARRVTMAAARADAARA